MNFVFLMDPLETVKIKKDTSFILMLCAHNRGHSVYYLPDGGIVLKDNKVFLKVASVVPQQVEEKPFMEQRKLELSEGEVDCVFLRSDPPFDEMYLMNTWLLDRLPKRIPVINNPNGIRTVNEKLWATQFSSLIPKTLVSRHKRDVLDFFAREKNVVVKPVNAFGGTSIFHVKKGDKNAPVAFETVSHNWTKEIIIQKYIPAAQNGDKRILLLNAEPLGAVLRVHAKDDHRNNFFAGGHPEKTTINVRDREIIKTLKPHFRKLGLYFVGIDIIGDYLTEVNVTSPTCLQEMNQLYGKSLEERVIDFAEKLIKTCNVKK